MKRLSYVLFWVMFISVAGFLRSSNLQASEEPAFKEKLNVAMSSELRSEKEKARDRNRLPLETLQFFGLRDDMSVVELIPGGGWYSKLLFPILKDKGTLTLAYGTTRAERALESFPDINKLNIAAKDAKIFKEPGARFYSLENAALDVDNADLILTFRNYHNFSASGRKAMNQAAFKALKKGGVYAVVDHTRRHMQSNNDENRRRIDPVLAIKEIQEAGFEFVDYSNLHYRLDDELVYEVGRKSVTGNTDRWTLKFVKK